MQKILDQAKLYKTVSETQVSNISEIRNALDHVANYLKKHKYPLYGGMAIDFALKSIGHKGIYSDFVMPDYDFISDQNIETSLDLQNYLTQQDMPNVDAINAIHLTTRKVRINKFNVVADITFCPEPYFQNIPLLDYKNLVIVHPDYQRIDFHRSLSFLYEGMPTQENFRNRLTKDVKRLNLIQSNIPVTEHKIESVDTKNILLQYFNQTPKKLQQKKLPKYHCLTGFATLIKFSEIRPDLFGDLKLTADSEVPDPLEVFVDNIDDIPKNAIYFEKTADIFPEAAYHENVIYYYNFGRLIAANNIKETWHTNIHYICASLLFKYFMLGNVLYLNYYKIMLTLLEQDQEPFRINGTYYGKANINETFAIQEKTDDCDIKKIKKNIRPMFNDKEPKVEKYITYNSGGKQIPEIKPKNFECDF